MKKLMFLAARKSCMSHFPGLVMALGLATSLFVAPVWAEIVEQPENQVLNVIEAGQKVQLDFVVLNNNPFPVILDYAYVLVTNGAYGSDVSDAANWPTFNAWSPTIAANSQTPFSIGFTISTPPPEDPFDAGINVVTFGTEWSPLAGNVLAQFVTSQWGLVWIDNDNSLIPTADYAQDLTNLLNYTAPLPAPPNLPMYVGGQQDVVFATINVYDVPEPATIGLLGLGALSLIRRKPQCVSNF